MVSLFWELIPDDLFVLEFPVVSSHVICDYILTEI